MQAQQVVLQKEYAGSREGKYLTFSLGGEEYGLGNPQGERDLGL